MTNDEKQAAREYHERTKHSPASVRNSRHVLDWEIQPRPFKIYTHIDPIPLPRQLSVPPLPTVQAIASPGVTPVAAAVPDVQSLALLLHFSAGITRKKIYAGGREMHFRAAACTGALYHIDLYVVCGELPDLAAGVYHFAPHDFSLRRLRRGDFRAALRDAAADEATVATAPAMIVCTSTFWRNTWKYQARAYRHCFWDSGTVLANLLAVGVAARLPTCVVMGFVDQPVNQLLDLDTRREVALAMVSIGYQPDTSFTEAPPTPRLSLETVPLSSREVDYPAIREVHAASTLHSPAEVPSWRTPITLPATPLCGETFPLQPLVEVPPKRLDDTILHRGSSRRFSHTAISFAELSTLLRSATRGVPADFLVPDASAGRVDPTVAGHTALSELYLIVNAVDGLPPGAYLYDRGREAVELIREGDLRREAGVLDLGQDLGADAAVNMYLLARLDPILERFGNRGYRAAQLEAAIVGGKLYLGAYALGLGATGLTFFDDDVVRFFSPHAAGKDVMFLVAIGRPRRAAR